VNKRKDNLLGFKKSGGFPQVSEKSKILKGKLSKMTIQLRILAGFLSIFNGFIECFLNVFQCVGTPGFSVF